MRKTNLLVASSVADPVPFNFDFPEPDKIIRQNHEKNQP